MPNVRRIILDETPFVFLTRNDAHFSLKPELARFIEKCTKKNRQRAYEVYMSPDAKRRLGFGRLYNMRNFLFNRQKDKRSLYEKRLVRRKMAKLVIANFKRPTYLRLKPSSWILMDLHLFANEQKRSALGRPLLPQEVIPLEMCQTALLAHERTCPLFSFNTDYQYFITLPLSREPYIQYWKPEDILKNLSI